MEYTPEILLKILKGKSVYDFTGAKRSSHMKLIVATQKTGKVNLIRRVRLKQ